MTRRSEVIDGRGHVDFVDRRTGGDWPEILLQQRLELDRIEIPGNRDAGVVGSVVMLEEVAHIEQPRRFDIGVGADDVSVIGMALGKS